MTAEFFNRIRSHVGEKGDNNEIGDLRQCRKWRLIGHLMAIMAKMVIEAPMVAMTIQFNGAIIKTGATMHHFLQ